MATASIVTTQAISLALGCSIASLTMVGNDLAFKDNYYASAYGVCQRFIMNTIRFSTANTNDYAMIHRKKMYMVKRRESIYYTDHQFWLPGSGWKTFLQTLRYQYLIAAFLVAVSVKSLKY